MTDKGKIAIHLPNAEVGKTFEIKANGTDVNVEVVQNQEEIIKADWVERARREGQREATRLIEKCESIDDLKDVIYDLAVSAANTNGPIEEDSAMHAIKALMAKAIWNPEHNIRLQEES